MNVDNIMNLLIAGDYLPTPANMQCFENGEINNVFNDRIIDLFKDADFSIANLEGCFYDGEEKIKKQGPTIKASVKSFSGYLGLGVEAINLANNHVRDYGDEGLSSTIELLEGSGILHFGAGKNIYEAKKPLIYEKKGLKIGFLGISEYEFTIATENEAGANPFDELYTLDDIADLKKQVDYVVVLYHGSKEYYRFPVPYVQKRCRRFIDKGADVVLCQHSHCIGCQEIYKDGYILYGQGNFCFCRADNEYTRSGLLVQIKLNKTDHKINLIPTVREKGYIRTANEAEKKKILDAFYERSIQIESPRFIQDNYSVFAKKLATSYDRWCTGKIGYALKKIRLNALFSCFFTTPAKYDMDMINMLRCEAHRDAYLQGLADRNNIRK